MNITEETKVKQIGDIDATDLDGEKVMMDLEKGCYFMLNDVATRIWDIAKEPKCVSDIVRNLLNEYEVDEQTCLEQVVTFVKQLVDLKLLSIQ